MMELGRREFLGAAAGACVAGSGWHAIGASDMAQEPKGASTPTFAHKGPLVISSGASLPTAQKAWELLQQGADPVDAAVAGVNIVEDDPNDHSVGYGGMPNEDGIVQLDACVMHGPTHKAGAVACLEKIRHPSSVAKMVLWRTDHVLLVGEGALWFALAMGFKEEELLTDESRRMWQEWKQKHPGKSENWLPPDAEKEAKRAEAHARGEFTYGTITCQAMTATGDIGGCTSTSGLSWKIPGRVGDSPIIGAGLYVDNAIGSAGSTGRGEANLQNLSSFLIVELMGQGRTPEEASLEALRRVSRHCEKRLRNEKGEPSFGLTFYAMRRDGLVGGANLRGPGSLAVCDASGARVIPLPGLY